MVVFIAGTPEALQASQGLTPEFFALRRGGAHGGHYEVAAPLPPQPAPINHEAEENADAL